MIGDWYEHPLYGSDCWGQSGGRPTVPPENGWLEEPGGPGGPGMPLNWLAGLTGP
jgi:hypothetical protein